MAQQLIAAADRKQRAAVFHIIVQITADLLKAGADNLLLPVGAAAKKDNVCGSQFRMIIEAAFNNICIDPAPLAPHTHTLNVAPVSIEIQEVGVEMYDIQPISIVIWIIAAIIIHFPSPSRYLCAS